MQVGADIVLTDKQALLPLIQHNIDKNLNEQERARIRTSELLWGTGISPFEQQPTSLCGEQASVWRESTLTRSVVRRCLVVLRESVQQGLRPHPGRRSDLRL
jgi:hypothetical protein